MKKALVLGGAGFIGSALVRALSALDVDVTAVDRYWAVKPDGVRCITGDVFDSSCLEDVMSNQEIVFHLVSTTVPASSNKSPVFDCETNVIGTLRILDAMVKNKVKKIVFSSSGGTVYGIPDSNPIAEGAMNFPISAYGIGKISVEKYIKLYSFLYDIQGVVLRLSNPFGPGQIPEKGQGVIATFVKRALLHESIEVWGDGSVIRDYIYIDDAIDAFIASMELDEPFSILNIGSGEGTSLLDILGVIERKLELKLSVSYHHSRVCDVPEVILNVQKAKLLLGWQTQYSFKDGMSRLLLIKGDN